MPVASGEIEPRKATFPAKHLFTFQAPGFFPLWPSPVIRFSSLIAGSESVHRLLFLIHDYSGQKWDVKHSWGKKETLTPLSLVPDFPPATKVGKVGRAPSGIAFPVLLASTMMMRMRGRLDGRRHVSEARRKSSRKADSR